MARALFLEEEKVLDSSVEKLYSPRQKRQICNFPSAVLVFVFLMALGSLLLIARKAGITDHSPGNTRSISLISAIVQRGGSAGKQSRASEDSIRRWESYLRFKEPAPRDPIVPMNNSFYRLDNLANHGNASLYTEIHPKEYCLAVLSRKAVASEELKNPSLFRDCYGRLDGDLRATPELYEIDLGYLFVPCQDIPVVAVVQTC